jgi:hypothetical protein
MGNVNLPTPLALAAGGICLLGGYLLGTFAGPDAPASSTATVESYDADSSRLCLSGEEVASQEGLLDDGVLCGTWRRTQGSTSVPAPGDQFQFVSLSAGEQDASGPEDQRPTTVIYGDVVG